VSFARAGSSPAFGTKIWRVWVFRLSINQLLAQQPGFAYSPYVELVRRFMPRQWPFGLPVGGLTYGRAGSRCSGSNFRVLEEIAPKAAQCLTLSLCPPYNSRPLE
jgi:hypothetical protein